MIKRFAFFIGFSLLILSCGAQFDTSFVKKNIRKCADSLTMAFKARDWEKFTRYSFPAMVGSLGGVTEFRNYISNMFSQVPDSAWKKYEPGTILQVLKSGKDLQAVIELKTEIDVQQSRISTTSHLVGESWDGGMFWTFFDAQGDARAARIIHPGLDSKLVIPARKEISKPIRN